ncbi:receptor-like protein 12 isoform X2 [Capsella rubella]|uniref:receptor-like protein 12 isoform X2 n=1 Tax=Capsella rubella TaxID=81985 RepID=UPI000CD525CC|nr:receptor-like protein 12 isoform X2 [Capsella rubella]
MNSCSERRMITIIWSLCLFFCLSHSTLVLAKHLCLPDQRDALSEFKNEFYVYKLYSFMDDKKTETWRNNTDCCSWDGVLCDDKTGNVVELNLYGSELNGPLRSNSSLFRLQHLQSLKLGSNNISGILPDSIGNLKYLRDLDLPYCSLFGKIPSSLGNLSHLTTLALSDNDFTGELPDSMGHLNNLTELHLGWAMLNGKFPHLLLNLSSLMWIDLGSNQFKGIGPLEFGNISSQSNLLKLDIGENNFYIVDFSIFLHFKLLEVLDLSGNHLKFSSTPHLLLPMIVYLDLSSCNISEFPKFLENQTSLQELDISANQIKGQIPEWLWRLPRLQVVNIAQNSFGGELTMLPNSIINTFIASDNQFSGEIPRAICELDNLGTLVLSNNNFSGSISRCFKNVNSSISILHLRNNSLSGIIPEEIINDGLRSLDVGGNLLSGKLPKSLINCTSLAFLNVENNRIKDKFPFWLSSLPNLQILVLRSNQFYGPIFSPGYSLSFPILRIFDISDNSFSGVLPSDYFVGWSVMSSFAIIYLNGLLPRDFLYDIHQRSVFLTVKGVERELVGSGYDIYKNFDVSGNRLEGYIPESIGLLKELIVLNMSNNAFTGHIPPSLSNLTNLESLDLSKNRLSGSIPTELGKLTFLEWMNFSYNKLEGPIPIATQIQSQNISSFAENPGLCGAPLLKKCGGEEEEAKKQEQDEDEKEEEDQVFNWVAAAVGYVPGLFCGLTIAYILTS